MAREKLNSKVVFGQKIHASLTNGCTCLHIISWDAFSESPSMMDCPERHNNLFGYYPKKVFADRAYCTRENRQKLKDLRLSCLFHLKSIPGFQFKSIPLLFRKQYLKKKGVPLSSSGLLAL
jgi:hypothetical protein